MNNPNAAQTLSSLMPVSDYVLECKLCGITFDSFQNLEMHSISPEHAQKVIEKYPSNSLSYNIVSTSSSSLKCGDEKMTVDEINNILPVSEDIKSQTDFYSCNPCHKVFNGPEPYKQHLESRPHKRKLESITSTETSRVGVQISCDPCKKIFSGQIPYNQHLNTEKHKMIVQSLQLSEENASDDDLVPRAKKMKTEDNNGEKDKESTWFCEFCKVHCSGQAPYSQHLAGRSHKKNVAKSQIESNSFDTVAPIQLVDQLQTIVQNLQCFEEKSISKVNAIFGEKKREEEYLKKDRQKSWFCKFCDIYCSGPVSYSQHIGGKPHKKNIYKIQRKKNCVESETSFQPHQLQSSNDEMNNVNGSLLMGENSHTQDINKCNQNIEHVDKINNVNESFLEGENSSLPQVINQFNQNVDEDFVLELKKSTKTFSYDEDINFD